MRRKTFLVLSFLSTALMSCARTGETYPYNYLDTGKFETNFYDEHKGVKQEQITSKVKLTIDNTVYNKHWKEYVGDKSQINGIKEEDQTYNGVLLDWHEDDNAEKGYGPNKCLSRINESFKNGILSRLYDGRVRCDGKTYARTRIQINESGYSCYFPKEINTAKYLAIALRGSTNQESKRSVAIEAHVDLHISFYQKDTNNSYREIEFVLENLSVESCTHGLTQLTSFYFEEAFAFNHIENYEQYLTGVNAMSISYQFKNAPLYEGEQFGLMLYEFMIPDSSWR